MKATLALSLAVLLFGIASAGAQAPDPDLSRRLEQLEAETRQLRAELQRAQEAANSAGDMTRPGTAADVEPSGPVYAVPAPALAAPADPPASPAATVPADYPTLDEVRGEIKRLQWTKGDFKVVPYGILWANMVYETQRTQVGDYTFYVLPERPNTQDQFHVDGRSTRLGIDVSGPQVPAFCCAASGGKIEFDFQRTIDTENRSGVLLRHAYVEVKNEDFRLLFGQTWDVISPLYPGMLMYSVGWGGGNIGYRRAQLRGERYLALSDTALVVVQGSLNADIIQEVSTTTFTGDQSGWPVLMGRVGMILGPRGQGCYPFEFGVSSHYGDQIFDFRAPFRARIGDRERTWSLNADFRFPMSERFGVQGEFFTGENLGAYLGGILQGVDVGTPANPGTGLPIRSTGGWVEAWYDWTPRLHNHVGWGVDDPINSDVTVGRIYNSFYFANLCFDVTQRFLIGFEFSYWKTLWQGLPNGESAHMDFVAKYAF